MNFTDVIKAEKELARAVASRNAEAIADAATTNVWPLYCEHYDALIAAIVSLPAAVLDRRPILRGLHPLTPVLARTSRPFKPLVTAEDARLLSSSELDVLTLVQMISFRLSGDVAAALIYAKRLEDRLAAAPAASHERTDSPIWYYHFQIGSTLLAAGKSVRALLELATARQRGKLSRQSDAERLALGRTALAHASRGSLDDAEAALEEIDQLGPVGRAEHDESVMTERAAAAFIAVERMSPDADALVAGLEPYDSLHMTWPYSLLARARQFLAHHRPDDALEAIRLARDAHPPQHGSFANDVIHSTSIDALWGVGDIAAARATAADHGETGPLSRLATIRLALNESRLDAAAKGLREVHREDALGPANRGEILLFSAWLEMMRAGSLSPETARQVRALAIRSDNRRLLAGVPREVIDLVHPHLSKQDAIVFDSALSGLSHVVINRRPNLTHSELRVLNALPVYETTAAIASRFHVSPNTIKSQLKAIYRKLECSTREEAVMIASRFHLITAVED